MTGSEGFTCGDAIDLVSDLMDDAELPEAVDGLGIEIRGAGLSAIHLHYHLISSSPAIVRGSALTLKNSPSVEL